MSSHPLWWWHHTYSVRHHRWHMYAIIFVIQVILSTLYDNLYYFWHHMHYIHSITCIIYEISSTLYDVTSTMCVTYTMTPIYGINHYMFMIYSLDMASGTVLWVHNHCVPSQPLCLTLHSIFFDISHNVPIVWEEVNVCHHRLYMYDTICTTYDITSTLYDFTPL